MNYENNTTIVNSDINFRALMFYSYDVEFID
jgi:hypothetical protein